jgi:CRISPR-associated protein Cas6
MTDTAAELLATPAEAAARPAGDDLVDLAYPLAGTLPTCHRERLAEVLDNWLPGWSAWPGAGLHRLNLSAGPGGTLLMSQRTRLVLRLPRHRVAEASALAGRMLTLGAHALQLGPAVERALMPWGTLYAHLVATDQPDEAGFMREAEAALRTLGLAGRAICGRHQTWEGGLLHGHSLMVDGLGAADALRLQQQGLGPHRRLGCGLFVPHRSASAVGAPA